MAFNFMLPLRITQFILGLLVLGLEAYVASWWNRFTLYRSPDRVNFLIFAGIWTALIVVPFLTLTPRFFPRAAHPFAILAIEAVTMVFWFAGFIAHAVFVANLLFCRGNVCRCAQAATVFAAFEWVLFTATTIMAIMHVMRTRNGGRSKRNPQMEVQT
ncbi:hypothetical protein EPUS_07602 [Endocarpon pusillum Z07020]|nr:uncharacterized protein EPUS_07602 [Endocarpon pusillum Z07020]ERF70337.1 hypothetical protein EPUS_07602 [Endocarpon pusillum Z07020]